MSYAKRKALKVKYELLAEGALLPGRKSDPFPILKEKLDHDFSELARMLRADDDGMVTCIDGCGKTGHWKEFDCGHFVDRDKLPTRWLLPNCWPQHPVCNRMKTGRRYEFGRALNSMVSGLADRLLVIADGPSEEIRFKAQGMLDDIRAKLKTQRKRFK